MAMAITTVSSFSITLSSSFNDTSLSSQAIAAALPRTSFLTKFVVPHSKPSLLISSFPLRHNLSVNCQQQQQQQLQSPAIPQEQLWMFEDSQINGPDIWNKTWYPKAADHVSTKKTWYIVDATDKILGRLASTIAVHIRGKNLATYTPSVDMGAYVIVVCG